MIKARNPHPFAGLGVQRVNVAVIGADIYYPAAAAHRGSGADQLGGGEVTSPNFSSRGIQGIDPATGDARAGCDVNGTLVGLNGGRAIASFPSRQCWELPEEPAGARVQSVEGTGIIAHVDGILEVYGAGVDKEPCGEGLPSCLVSLDVQGVDTAVFTAYVYIFGCTVQHKGLPESPNMLRPYLPAGVAIQSVHVAVRVPNIENSSEQPGTGIHPRLGVVPPADRAGGSVQGINVTVAAADIDLATRHRRMRVHRAQTFGWPGLVGRAARYWSGAGPQEVKPREHTGHGKARGERKEPHPAPSPVTIVLLRAERLLKTVHVPRPRVTAQLDSLALDQALKL